MAQDHGTLGVTTIHDWVVLTHHHVSGYSSYELDLAGALQLLCNLVDGINAAKKAQATLPTWATSPR